MYFDHDAVQVDLDSSYLANQASARSNAEQIASNGGVQVNFVEPKNFTASQLPDIPTTFSYMTCPRTISDLSSKIGLGYIGPKVRRIIKSSAFPVLMTSTVYKAWQSLMVFYGGSINAHKSLRWGLHLAEVSGVPLDMMTFAEGQPRSTYEDQLKAADMLDQVNAQVRQWYFIEQGSMEEHLLAVPHDALLVLGAYGHGLIKDILFGSKMETIQSWMPNSMLLVGPNSVFGR
jgi:nucleotide-binding universal stress UspA family protein